MKKREDIDWKLFELFENDLSAAEEAEILNEIENNEGLEEDWKLLQQTKLVAPEISYANKKSLLKKETKVIALSNFNWLKYAAALIIVVAAYPIWKNYLSSKDVNRMASSAGEVIDHKDEVIPKHVEDLTPQQTEESVDVKVSDMVSVPVQDVRKEKTSIRKEDGLELDSSLPTHQPNLGTESLEVLVSVAPKERYTIKSESEIRPILNYGSMDYSSLYIVDDEQETLVKKYRGIRPALNGGLAWLSSPFKNSKLKIKPVEDNRGALQIEFTSKQYYATAMVSLKPIKE